MTEAQELIKKLREQGVTKYRMAKVTGTAWQSIHAYERGMYSPRPDKLALLQSLLSESTIPEEPKNEDLHKV